MTNYDHFQTAVVIIVFSVWYLFGIVRRTAKNQMDIYDLLMLSTVAIFPVFFVAFPDIAMSISQMIGIAFPFVLLFAILISILFIFIHRLTVKVHKIECDNRLLIQELSILKSQKKIYDRSD